MAPPASVSRRGRLSSIDLLPPECEDDVTWAAQALAARDLTAADILVEFNARLAAKDQGPISPSAFNRYSVAQAKQLRNMTRTRELAALFAERMDQQPDGDVGLLLIEVIKTLVHDVMVDASLSDASAGIKFLKEASIAVQKLEQARKTNIDTRAKIADRFVSDAADAAEVAARKTGLSAKAARAIREQVLGVRKAAS